MSARQSAHTVYPRGISLVVVLITLGAAFSLAAALAGLADVELLAARDVGQYAQAQYLAESGLAEAAYFIANPDPEAPEGFWTGVAQRYLDGSANYYDVVVTQDAQDSTVFHALATGHIVGPAGEIVAVSLTRTFTFSPSGVLPYDLMATGDVFLPESVTLTGDAYASGDVVNEATIVGNVTATGSITNDGIITGQTSPNSPEEPFPDLTLSEPLTYTYQGTEYQATEITVSFLRNTTLAPDPVNNPMGVFIRHGDLEIRKNTEIIGTLIVTGDLLLKNTGNTITAQPGFPGLMCNQMRLTTQNADLVLDGALIVQDKIQRDAASLKNSVIEVNGPLLVLNSNPGFDSSFSDLPANKQGSFTINHDASRMDISGLFPP